MFVMPPSPFQNSSARWVFSSFFSAACLAGSFTDSTSRAARSVTCACVKWKQKKQRLSMKSVVRNKNVERAPAPRLYPSRRRGRPKIQLPFVAVTFAMTADGKVTTKNYASVDFTSREDKADLIRQRALGDAVLVGHGTIENDNVRLGIPREDLRKERIARGQSPYPIRVIVSNKGRINPRLKNLQTDFAPIIIFSTTRMPLKTRKQLQEKAT